MTQLAERCLLRCYHIYFRFSTLFFFLSALPAAVSRWTRLPSGAVFGIRRSAIRRRGCGVAPVLRRGKPLYPDVRGFQGSRGRDGTEGARWHPVQAGIVGHVHRWRVPGRPIYRFGTKPRSWIDDRWRPRTRFPIDMINGPFFKFPARFGAQKLGRKITLKV